MTNNQKKIDDIKHWAMVNHHGVNPSVSFSKSEFDWLIEHVEQLERQLKRYEFALTKIMNTQCFMSNNKMQYTTAGQIAKKALES